VAAAVATSYDLSALPGLDSRSRRSLSIIASVLTLFAILLIFQTTFLLVQWPVTPAALNALVASFAIIGLYLCLMMFTVLISLVRRRPVRISIEEDGVRFYRAAGQTYLSSWRDFGTGAILTAPLTGTAGYRLDLPVPGGMLDYLTFRGPRDRAASLTPDAFVAVKAAIEAVGIPVTRHPPGPSPIPEAFVVYLVGDRGSISA
jgi:hypothetical protein